MTSPGHWLSTWTAPIAVWIPTARASSSTIGWSTSSSWTFAESIGCRCCSTSAPPSASSRSSRRRGDHPCRLPAPAAASWCARCCWASRIPARPTPSSWAISITIFAGSAIGASTDPVSDLERTQRHEIDIGLGIAQAESETGAAAETEMRTLAVAEMVADPRVSRRIRGIRQPPGHHRSPIASRRLAARRDSHWLLHTSSNPIWTSLLSDYDLFVCSPCAPFSLFSVCLFVCLLLSTLTQSIPKKLGWLSLGERRIRVACGAFNDYIRRYRRLQLLSVTAMYIQHVGSLTTLSSPINWVSNRRLNYKELIFHKFVF